MTRSVLSLRCGGLWHHCCQHSADGRPQSVSQWFLSASVAGCAAPCHGVCCSGYPPITSPLCGSFFFSFCFCLLFSFFALFLSFFVFILLFFLVFFLPFFPAFLLLSSWDSGKCWLFVARGEPHPLSGRRMESRSLQSWRRVWCLVGTSLSDFKGPLICRHARWLIKLPEWWCCHEHLWQQQVPVATTPSVQCCCRGQDVGRPLQPARASRELYSWAHNLMTSSVSSRTSGSVWRQRETFDFSVNSSQIASAPSAMLLSLYYFCDTLLVYTSLPPATCYHKHCLSLSFTRTHTSYTHTHAHTHSGRGWHDWQDIKDNIHN